MGELIVCHQSGICPSINISIIFSEITKSFELKFNIETLSDGEQKFVQMAHILFT